MHHAPMALRGAPHVIVVGNEKGGSGKTTLAAHVAVALMKAGQRVATIDLDSGQSSLTHYVENRRYWAHHRRIALEIPNHHRLSRADGNNVADTEAREFAAFAQVIASVQQSHDFLVIDTPAADSYLMRLAHLATDTLLTPIHDSFIDFGVLASIDPVTLEVVELRQYAGMVRAARQQRRQFDRGLLDWIVIRNRFSRPHLLDASLRSLEMRLGLRVVDGCGERVVYRKYFPAGLTALDDLDEVSPGTLPTRDHQAAQQEVRDLLELLRLPTNARGLRRAALRREWMANADAPLETLDILVE